jgi:hypothetical protein
MKKRIYTYVILICIPFLSLAQWTDNSMLNTEIKDTTGAQVLAKVAVNPENGESYISWFSESGNNQYDVYMQRLDENGVKLWDEEGLLISNHTTMSWVTNYDLQVDNDGCAILVTQDIRTGNSDVFAYRISPEGNFLWGNDGIPLTNDMDFNPSPIAIIDQNGNIVFAWTAEPADTTQYSTVNLLKYSKDGLPLWAEEVVIGNDSMHCFMPYFLAAEDNTTIAVWIETATADTAIGDWPNMYAYAQKIDSEGNFVWSDKVAIDTSDNMPLKFFNPSLVSDDNGGFLIGWMAFPEGPFYSSYVQHINSSGEAQWAQNGVNVSDSMQFHHTDPLLIYLPQDDELFVFWNEYREYPADVKCAIFGQKFSNTGEKLWTSQGEMFDGLYSCYDTLTQITGISPAFDDDFTIFYEKEFFSFMPDTVIVVNYHAMRISSDGGFVWNNEKPFISSAMSTKYSLACSKLINDQWIIAWSDNRKNPDSETESGIYAQNVLLNGLIGPVSVNDQKKIESPNITVFPNPANSIVHIYYDIQNSGVLKLDLLDVNGRLIKHLYQGKKAPGTHSLQSDVSGLAPGMYLIKLQSGNSVAFQKMIKN